MRRLSIGYFPRRVWVRAPSGLIQTRFFLTNPNTSCTIEVPASLRFEVSSLCNWNAVRVSFGIGVHLRRSPHPAAVLDPNEVLRSGHEGSNMITFEKRLLGDEPIPCVWQITRGNQAGIDEVLEWLRHHN